MNCFVIPHEMYRRRVFGALYKLSYHFTVITFSSPYAVVKLWQPLECALLLGAGFKDCTSV